MGMGLEPPTSSLSATGAATGADRSGLAGGGTGRGGEAAALSM